MPDVVELPLTSPAELGPTAAVLSELRDCVRAVELACAAERGRTGRRVLGRRAVLAQSWRDHQRAWSLGGTSGPGSHHEQVGADRCTAAQPRVCHRVRQRPRAMARRPSRRVPTRHVLALPVRVSVGSVDVSRDRGVGLAVPPNKPRTGLSSRTPGARRCTAGSARAPRSTGRWRAG